MLATRRQLDYLQDLAIKTEQMKREHPSLVPLGLIYETFDRGMTSDYASILIRMYRETLDKCYDALKRARRAKSARS